MNFETILDGAAVIAAIIALIGVIYIAMNKAALDNYRATVDSQDARIKALTLDKEDLRCRISKLEGVKDGYELASELMVKAVLAAGVCAIVDCPNRQAPTVDRRDHQ